MYVERGVDDPMRGEGKAVRVSFFPPRFATTIVLAATTPRVVFGQMTAGALASECGAVFEIVFDQIIIVIFDAFVDHRRPLRIC